jgi:mitochondrial import inner membrane translocase subunit TIM17
MGAVGGGIWHMLKGMKNSPGGARFRGGFEVSEG